MKPSSSSTMHRAQPRICIKFFITRKTNLAHTRSKWRVNVSLPAYCICSVLIAHGIKFELKMWRIRDHLGDSESNSKGRRARKIQCLQSALESWNGSGSGVDDAAFDWSRKFKKMCPKTIILHCRRRAMSATNSVNNTNFWVHSFDHEKDWFQFSILIIETS